MQKIVLIVLLGSAPFFLPYIFRRENEHALLFCSFGFYMFLSTLSLSVYHHIRFESVLYFNIFICALFGYILGPLASISFHKDAPRHMTEAAVLGFTTTGYLWIGIVISVILLR